MTKSIGQNRILQEMKNMVKDRPHNIFAQPLENDLFIWHFTFMGPENTDFHQGLYHGQIVLPFQYPFKPPDIYFFNKNGRFQTDMKICLTITQYHPEEWNAAWTIRTMLQAVISLFNEHVPGVGYVESTSDTRKHLAKESANYVCPKCGPIRNIMAPRKPIQSVVNPTKVTPPAPSSDSRWSSGNEPEQIQTYKLDSENIETGKQQEVVQIKQGKLQYGGYAERSSNKQKSTDNNIHVQEQKKVPPKPETTKTRAKIPVPKKEKSPLIKSLTRGLGILQWTQITMKLVKDQ